MTIAVFKELGTDNSIRNFDREKEPPMPYALCPMPCASGSPNLPEKGYIKFIPRLKCGGRA
ncbi:MAG: hypothetical protein WBL95_18380 [Microcoleus sp.]